MFSPWYHHHFMAPHRFNIFNAPPPAPAAVGARGPASCAPPSPAPSPLRSTGKQWKNGGRCVWHIWKMLPKTGKCCGRSWKMEKRWGPVSKMSKHAEGLWAHQPPTLGVSFAMSSHFKKNKHQRPRVLVQYGGITHFHEKRMAILWWNAQCSEKPRRYVCGILIFDICSCIFQILDGSTMDVCGKSPAPAESCTTRGDQVLLGLESREDGHWLGCISIIELHCT